MTAPMISPSSPIANSPYPIKDKGRHKHGPRKHGPKTIARAPLPRASHQNHQREAAHGYARSYVQNAHSWRSYAPGLAISTPETKEARRRARHAREATGG